MKSVSCVQLRQLIFSLYRHLYSVYRDSNSKEIICWRMASVMILKSSMTYWEVLALEAFYFFDFSTDSGDLFKCNIDKKCSELGREYYWFKTGAFKIFALKSKSSYQRQLVWYGRILVSFNVCYLFPNKHLSVIFCLDWDRSETCLNFYSNLSSYSGFELMPLHQQDWVSRVHAGFSQGTQ